MLGRIGKILFLFLYIYKRETCRGDRPMYKRGENVFFCLFFVLICFIVTTQYPLSPVSSRPKILMASL